MSVVGETYPVTVTEVSAPRRSRSHIVLPEFTTCKRDTPMCVTCLMLSEGCITFPSMFLTGTESLYDDLWSTAIYDHTSGQYTVTYRADVEEGYTAAVWEHLPLETLVVIDQYFDVDLDREVVILQRRSDAEA